MGVAAASVSQAAGSCFMSVISAAEQGVPLVAEVGTLYTTCKTGASSACADGITALVGTLGKLEGKVTQAVGDCGAGSEGCTTGLGKIGDDISKLSDLAKGMGADCAKDKESCLADAGKLVPAVKPLAADIEGAARDCAGHTSYDWCDCGAGSSHVDVWDPNHPEDKHRVKIGGWTPITWKSPVSDIKWVCDGMSVTQSAHMPAHASWRVSFTNERKTICFPHPKSSGRIEWDSSGNTTDSVIV